VYGRWWWRWRLRMAQVDAQELPPIGLKPLRLEHRGEPGTVNGNARAFDVLQATLVEGSNGFLYEDFPDLRGTPLW
jgi:hypothetical protein